MILLMEDCNKLSDREHYTLKHQGKMTGIPSLSTSRSDNRHCQENQKREGTVSQHCYVNRQEKMYKNLSSMLSNNSEILKREIYPLDYWPLINAAFFRLESFGDVDCLAQQINYFNLCKRNPYTTFAQWTKNPVWAYLAGMRGQEKPENLIIICSSLFLNKPENISYINEYNKYVDKVFTVYDRDYAREHDISINCGGKRCLECQLCYHKDNGVEYINELLK